MKDTVSYTQKTYVLSENNPMKRFFINIWFNNVFRIVVIMGIPLVFLAPFVAMLSSMVSFPVVIPVLVGAYILSLFALMLYNDYENLNRIGKDVNGKPLLATMVNNQKYYVKRNSKWRYANEPPIPDSFVD